MTSIPLGPGSHLAHRWRLEHRLGAGAMGEVFAAHDEVLDRPVAVKVLGPGLAEDPDLVARFEREAMASARLAHPNVVAAYDLGRHENAPFIVMERVYGETLDEMLQARGPLSPRVVAKLGRDVARGLAAAHAQGIIHRDIKPGNVMVCTLDGQTVGRVMDFGIAQQWKAERRLTLHGGAVGTPGYISPEQMSGQQVSAASDIFALGVSMYEVLTGRLPWEGDAPLEILAASMHTPPLDLGALRPELSSRLRELIMSMLLKAPGDRPATATQVARALDEILTSRSESGSLADETSAHEATHETIVAVSLSRGQREAVAQVAWFKSALAGEGGLLKQVVGRELLGALPSPEAALRLCRTEPNNAALPGLALHLGATSALADGAVHGSAARVAIRLARVCAPGEVLVSEALHDAVGLGWRGRMRPRGELVIDPQDRHHVFRLVRDFHVVEEPTQLQSKTGERLDGAPESARLEYADGHLHWRCPCDGFGPVPEDRKSNMRVRCSRCSRLLQIDHQVPALAPGQGHAADDGQHPLSSIVLRASESVSDDDTIQDNALIDALSSLF